jgi:DNA invertase Pin-like site-specific DNA recombinase
VNASVAPSRITKEHLDRDALLYVRQSSPHQVLMNTESTERQYRLKDRAIAMGWPSERVKTIDEDLGHSGASTVGRDGFQKLVAEVSMGRVGLVMGLEVSRLARNNADWHRLLEICAMNNSLILDEDGLYNPNDFNDRLVLGLKGTMSEAELHFIRARLRGGILNKARRGELRIPLPVGFVYSEEGKPVFDPDQQVRDTIRLFFRTYAQLGSAHATVKMFHQKGIPFPRRPRVGPHKGEVLWAPVHYVNALLMLRNPRYAGAYVFGRWRRHGGLRRRTQVLKPREEWDVFLPGSHPGYISWDDYERNLRQLHATAQASGVFQRQGPPREGPALLQGLALCGLCGYRMQIHYRKGNGTMSPVYHCSLTSPVVTDQGAIFRPTPV